MSSDNSPVLSRKTWARSIEPVTKIGYTDGASDGQYSVYQQSFDIGYEQGFSFGLQLGFQETFRPDPESVLKENVTDPRRINCHICINKNSSQENVVDLFNSQKERNCAILQSETDKK